ncbi:hypothetical protein NDI37_15025 [Funiculus sociatus GB2-A5]|uniref:Uncharacterized protein n=1 Tax=Funiculus sociatus GB2-A5 TaxID=2933946 RepID=A0ABV0JQL8_9CYAN|nr:MULTISPECIES: hypothetical protein [unclassified Trichocoleus]MBD1908152.1 hypothetical protein [Trichocoleus sp. FACHB-832]MBD2062017.1 hypothetical protein [Trichocoleus sp. FACHB-6]
MIAHPPKFAEKRSPCSLSCDRVSTFNDERDRSKRKLSVVHLFRWCYA